MILKNKLRIRKATRFLWVFSFCFGFILIHAQERLKQGDILFQDLDCGSLCHAIESVTEGVDGRDFSHCGMVFEIEGELLVLEAISDAVKLTPLNTFLARSNDLDSVQNIVAMRFKPEFESVLGRLNKLVSKYVGAAYDSVFNLNNQAYYCSELLYFITKEANQGKPLFNVQPMTFKKPNENTFFAAWVNYYNKLGVEIPEGKPGLNPGSISRSSTLRKINFKHTKLK